MFLNEPFCCSSPRDADVSAAKLQALINLIQQHGLFCKHQRQRENKCPILVEKKTKR